jgi:hypothetical protein
MNTRSIAASALVALALSAVGCTGGQGDAGEGAATFVTLRLTFDT